MILKSMAAVAACVVLAACGGTADNVVSQTGRVGGGTSAAAASGPKRIVSMSPTATETLFAIGAGGQVVAVDDQSDYPVNAPRTRLSAYEPNAEAVARYNPDLVVISNDTKTSKAT